MTLTHQEAISLVEKLTGANLKDLVDNAKESDLSSLESLESLIKPAITKVFRENSENSFKTGHRKGMKEFETKFKEVFDEDITSDTALEVFKAKHELLNAQKDKKKITLQEAMQHDEIKNHIAALADKAKQAEKIQKEFDTYKKVSHLKSTALDAIIKAGGKLSDNPKIKEMQLKDLEDTLSNISFSEKGEVLDQDGNILIDTQTGRNYTMTDYLKEKTAFDFSVTTTTQKVDKNIPNPTDNAGGGNTFGFTDAQIKAFTAQDKIKALNEGNQEKANFIYKKIVENEQSKNQ